jgi:hypothetical protein
MLAVIQFKSFCLPVSYKKLKMKIYITIILPVVLYGCKTWSLTLREEHGLRVLRIFGPETEGDGSWQKLHNDELHSLYSSPDIVRVITSMRMRWAGHAACVGRRKMFMGRPKCRWEDNIKMDLREVGINGGELDLADSVWNPVASFCEHGNEPLGSIKKAGYCLTS